MLALGLSLAASAAVAQTPVELKVGDPAPDFSLLSDPTKKTAGAYGVLNQRGMAAKR